MALVITFDGNDSCRPKANLIPGPVIGTAGQNMIIPDTVPKRRHCCFRAWNTDPCGEGTWYLPGETIHSLINDLYLYAIWQKNRFCCPCPPPVTSSSFTTQKLDSDTGAGLPGAAFTLSMNGEIIQTSVSSDENGSLSFTGLKPGEYELRETAPPNGYEADSAIHQVIVDIDGTVTIDGVPSDSYSLYNTASAEGTLSFIKTGSPAEIPLPGASFALSDGTTAVSAEDGTVDFGSLPPGTYTLSETAAPQGYIADSSLHTVFVDEDGTVTVDGRPLSDFRPQNTVETAATERPVIVSIEEGDTSVTGTGIPGAAVNVLFPDGTQAQTTVDENGRWFVSVPPSTVLEAGQTVYANQTVPGLAPSESASFIVQPRM